MTQKLYNVKFHVERIDRKTAFQLTGRIVYLNNSLYIFLLADTWSVCDSWRSCCTWLDLTYCRCDDGDDTARWQPICWTVFLHGVLSEVRQVASYRHNLHGCYQSTSSLVFPWGGDHVYDHVEAHMGIAVYACDSHDQSMSVCASVRREQCLFQCPVPSSHRSSVYDLFLLFHRSSSILTSQKLVTSSFVPPCCTIVPIMML